MKYLILLLALCWASITHSIDFITYYVNDQVGTPVAAIDNDLGLVATRTSTGYGTEKVFTGDQAAFGSHGYTGQIDRSNNELVYFNARYYMPELRRFVSPDPVTVADGDYKHIDRYGYAYGNPVNANDPSGEVAETPWDIANAVMGWGTFAFDVSAGNWWGAAESGVGALYDTASIFVPGLPGGASTVIKGKRATEALVTKAVKEFDTVPYRPTNSPLVNHHGINDVWAKNNIPGYKSRASDNPTMALSVDGHKAAHRAGNDYLRQTMGSVRGQAKNLSPRQMQEMAEWQFDAANVPMDARQNFYNEFNRYIYGQF